MTLRPLAADDWQAAYSWGSRPEFCRYQAWGPDTPRQSRDFVEAAILARTRVPQERFVYLASLDGQPVGTGELKILSQEHRQGEIAYGVHPDFWGRGVGTEVGRQLMATGFGQLDLHRITATCDPRNVGSAGVLRRLGMVREGRLRDVLLIRDGWRDSEVFGILEQEWAGLIQSES